MTITPTEAAAVAIDKVRPVGMLDAFKTGLLGYARRAAKRAGFLSFE
jgi:hypothetical protein